MRSSLAESRSRLQPLLATPMGTDELELAAVWCIKPAVGLVEHRLYGIIIRSTIERTAFDLVPVPAPVRRSLSSDRHYPAFNTPER